MGVVSCGVLEQAVERGVIDTYYLKGGVAMELRFARAARTTKDFDLGLVGSRAERIRKLEQILTLGFDAFTFRLKPGIHHMEAADTVRVEVAVQYKTRSWQTVEIDLGPAEACEGGFVRAGRHGRRRGRAARHTACALHQHSRAGRAEAARLYGTARGDRAGDVLDMPQRCRPSAQSRNQRR